MAHVVLAPIHTRLLKTWTAIAQSAVQVPLTGTLTETTAATIAIPANEMGANGMIRITTLWSYNNNANIKTPRVKFDGNVFFTTSLTTTISMQEWTLIRNRNATNSQIGGSSAIFGTGTNAGANVTSAVDTTASKNVTITAQLANTGDNLNLEAYMVELLYGA